MPGQPGTEMAKAVTEYYHQYLDVPYCEQQNQWIDVIIGITMQMLITTNTIKHERNEKLLFSHMIEKLIFDILMTYSFLLC